MKTKNSLAKRIAACGGIAVFVIMALEVMIMISPFAFFFYSVFSPVFNFLGQHAATRWATSRPVAKGTAWKDVPTPEI